MILLNQFPNINWLKNQINSNFKSQMAWDNSKISNPGWPSVILHVKAKEEERVGIKGPFSLFMNINGSSEIKVGDRQIKINEQAGVVTNRGQYYDLIINNEHTTETLNFHFGEKLYLDSLKVYTHSHEKLLDDPFAIPEDHLIPINTIFKTPRLKKLMKAVIESRNGDPMSVDENTNALLHYLFEQNLKKSPNIKALKDLRMATRQELIRRLWLAIDYMHVNFNKPISLDLLAEKSCLSKFHFSRSFKKIMGYSPYQYLKSLKVIKALELYETGKWTLQEIAGFIGIEDASSVSRLIHQHVGEYPSKLPLKN